MDWLSMLFGDTQTPPWQNSGPSGGMPPSTQPGNPNAPQGGLWVDTTTDYEKPEELPWYYGLFGGDGTEGGGGGGGGFNYNQQVAQAQAPNMPDFAIPQQQRERRQKAGFQIPAYLQGLMGG